MTLDDYLTPLKWLDEQVLRQYTKLCGALETLGESKYSAAGLCTGSGVLGGILLAFHGGSEYFPIIGHSDAEAVGVGVPFFILANLDLWHSTRGMQGRNKDVVSEAVARDFPYHYVQQLQRVVRFPLFGSGTAFLGLAMAGRILGDPSPDVYYNLGEACAFGGLASSMYLKDSNPKLLEKQPFWKTAYEWMKNGMHKVNEKIKSASPEPQPVPVRS